MSEIRIEEVIGQLREQLELAVIQGKGEGLQFELQEVEVELQVVVSKGGAGKVSGEAGIWVLSKLGAQIEGKYDASQLQKVKLKLRPLFDEGGGKRKLAMLVS